MARDVEVNVTANDKVGNGLAAAERKFNETAKRIDALGQKSGDSVGKSMLKSINTVSPVVASTLVKSLQGVAGVGAPLLGGMAVAAAPLIASSLAGGIIGGAGIGGVVGGLMVASKDPRVASAIDGLGDNMQDRLEAAAGSFIGPAIEGIDIIEDALDTIDIEGIFEKSSKFVVPLAEGVGRAMAAMGDGIEDLVDNAGPVIDQIADGIGDIGEEIGEGLSSLADNGESAADALETVFDTIELVTDATFGLINGVMEAKEFFDEFAGGIFAFDSGLTWLNRAFGDSEEVVGTWVEGVEEGEAALTDFQKAMRDVSDEILAQTDPLFGLLDAQNQVTDAQKAYNDALRKHGPRSQEAQEALANLGQAAFRMNGKVGDAAGGFNGKLTPAMRTALRNANLSEHQIDKLEKQLRDAAQAAKAWEGTFQQTYLVTRKENVSYAGNSVTGGRASGGPVEAGQSYLVGENGPEILQMGNRQGNVIPNHALGSDDGGDLYLTLDLGKGITERLRIDRRDLKRRATAGAR